MKRPHLACRLLLVGLVCLAMLSGLHPMRSAGAFALSSGPMLTGGAPAPRNQSDESADADGDTPTPNPTPEQEEGQKSVQEPELKPASDPNTSQEPEPEDSSDVDPEPDPADEPQEVTAVEPQPANEGDEAPPVTAENDTASESGAVEENEDAPPAEDADSPTDEEPKAENDEPAIPEEDAAPPADDDAADQTDEETAAPADADQDADRADDTEDDVTTATAEAEEESKDDAPKGKQARAALASAPVAVDDDFTVLEDQQLVVPAPGPLANDTVADGDPLEFGVVPGSGPSHGTLSGVNSTGAFTYTPDAGFAGTDSFQYRADDEVSVSNTATVTITVDAVNTPPVANDDQGALATDESTSIRALANDIDADGDTLTIAEIVDPPTHGLAAIFLNGTQLSYTPASGFVGTDSLTYRATDGSAESNLATVTITVFAAIPSVAGDDAFPVEQDATLTVAAPGLLANDFSPRGLPLIAFNGDAPSHGTVHLFGDGSFQYTPEPGFVGTDSFTYSVTDEIVASDPATVTITVTEVAANRPARRRRRCLHGRRRRDACRRCAGTARQRLRSGWRPDLAFRTHLPAHGKLTGPNLGRLVHLPSGRRLLGHRQLYLCRFRRHGRQQRRHGHHRGHARQPPARRQRPEFYDDAGRFALD